MHTETIYADSTGDLRAVGEKAADVLRSGQPVALPAETVYGLAADALNPEAVARVFEAKGRPAHDPLIVHIANRDQLRQVADVPEEIEDVLKQLRQEFWPGALTIVLPKTDAVPDSVTSGLPTVAVRMPADPVFRAVLKAFGGPLAAPSANRFGRISPTSAAAVEEELGGRIPLIIDGGASKEGVESTIIKIEHVPNATKPNFHILRPGPVTIEMLKPIGRCKLPGKNRSAEQIKVEAPGQLDAHYAPRTPLRLIEDPADFTPEEGKRYALLTLDGGKKSKMMDAADWEVIEILSPGAGKLPEAAVRFYHLLRKLDGMDVDEIIAEAVPTHGLGIALMDRMRRAAVGSGSAEG
ncbi:L-threonylcarbamoyladenylate synthase [Sulfuriroseicoccus oceanibius]|uniref:Threonylcarbamoyl-AMP synthase n=1 Tax=Sulfuriroseicoccus oceanibius TaxID=2707525 RepID=A0A6B3LD93_9BACT|nr:L-threonylcarbamoyladenylate synthase [Sulfuriroseicoccus oceanibius]QQL45062.1 threonylcarbamoyl-AMP synthase [Sulfuriroseicoccus oceanibius]